MTTDFRALCAELIDALDECQRPYGDQPESFLVWKARAALAEQPVEPTDEELREMFNENDWNYISPETFEDIARAVLARWGNHQVSLTSSTQPLPKQEANK